MARGFEQTIKQLLEREKGKKSGGDRDRNASGPAGPTEANPPRWSLPDRIWARIRAQYHSCIRGYPPALIPPEQGQVRIPQSKRPKPIRGNRKRGS